MKRNEEIEVLDLKFPRNHPNSKITTITARELLKRPLVFSSEKELHEKALGAINNLCATADLPKPLKATSEYEFYESARGRPPRCDIYIEHENCDTVVEIKLVRSLYEMVQLITQLMMYRELAERDQPNINLMAIIDGKFYTIGKTIADRYAIPIKWILADGDGMCLLT